MQPKRIQIKCIRGWRLPKNTVVVTGQTKWGNPYHWESYQTISANPKESVTNLYRRWIYSEKQAELRQQIKTELQGKDVACWCKPDEPCHADIILKIANER